MAGIKELCIVREGKVTASHEMAEELELGCHRTLLCHNFS